MAIDYQRQQELWIACEGNDVATVNRLLTYHPTTIDPNEDYMGLSPFIWASFFALVDIVDRLLQDERVNPAVRDNLPIRVASMDGCVAVKSERGFVCTGKKQWLNISKE
jgi:hypothetical protein